MASNSSAVDSKDSSMVKVRLEMEDTEKEARNPLRSSLTEERLSADVRHIKIRILLCSPLIL